MSRLHGAAPLLLAALLLGGGACERKDEVVIFATARTQGRLWASQSPDLGGKTGGGFSVFRRLYDLEKRPKLALYLGDWSSATPEGWLTKGRSTIDCLNAVPFGAAAVGFEDLSLQPQELQKLATASKIPLLASNLYLRNNKEPAFLTDNVILPAGSRKIGVFSLAIASAEKPERQQYMPNYKLEKASYEAEKAVKELKEGGAQVIVMLLVMRQNGKADQAFFRALLDKFPQVDLIICDDPSIKKIFRAGRTWITSAGPGLTHASRITLDLEPSTGRLTGVEWDKVPLYLEKYGEDPRELKVISTYRKAAADHFARRIGFLADPLPLSFNGTSPVADFAADCMRRWARSNAAIIALSEPAAGFSSGTVTVGDLYSAFPLDSNVVFVKIRGDDLERALSGLPPNGIAVSGLKVFFKDGTLDRTETDSGPLVPSRVYHLAVPDSLVSGRDNPLLSSAMEFANSRRCLREVIGWCFSRQKSVQRPEGDRIVRN
jgi:2',3'-cyclic-nucleotide 2'-phosphodiesterase (5'-nucleotidase family)